MEYNFKIGDKVFLLSDPTRVGVITYIGYKNVIRVDWDVIISSDIYESSELGLYIQRVRDNKLNDLGI